MKDLRLNRLIRPYIGALVLLLSLLTACGGTAPNFKLELSTEALSIAQGNQDSLSITIVKEGGFDDEVTLELTGETAGIATSFSQNPLRSNSTLELTIAADAAIGDRSLTIKASKGALVKEKILTLTISEVSTVGTGIWDVSSWDDATWAP